MKRYFAFIFVFINIFFVCAQINYEHISTVGIYDFLDEMASMHIITINDVIKPYSRKYIADKLTEIKANHDKLNSRQKKEFFLYLNEFDLDMPETYNDTYNTKFDLLKKDTTTFLNPFPPELRYSSNTSDLSIKPIWGISYRVNQNGDVRHTWGGLGFYSNLGKHLGVYASLRDNYSTQLLSLPGYFTLEPGGNYKINEGGRKGGDWSEMRGGITYNWKSGSIGVLKDHIVWGTGYHGSNILSGRTPSFPMIKLNLHPFEWLDFNYFHGWLVSEVIDSTRSYITSNGDRRNIYRNKYIAANMFTVRPWKWLNFSFGNSIIYSDKNIHLAYLIPPMFFKSIDHTLNHNVDNENSQIFINYIIRPVQHLSVYSSVFVDDFSVTRINDKSRNNFISQKYGIKIFNWPIDNIAYNFEYTRTVPVVFKHRIPSATFETNKFNLGHFLIDNSEDYYVNFNYSPFSRFDFIFEYSYSWHANEYEYTDGAEAERYPVLKDKTWDANCYTFDARYQFWYNSYIFITLELSNIKGYNTDGQLSDYYLDKYTPDFYQGETETVSFGFNLGF